MITLAALVHAALSLVVVGFHLALIAGAPLGHLTMGGRWPGRLPVAGRIAAGLSALVMLAMTAVVLDRAGLLALGLPPLAGHGVAGFLGLSVALHLATPSAPERRLWLPVILAMAAMVALVLRG